MDDALLRQDVVMKTTRGGGETMTDGAQFPLLTRGGESPRTMDQSSRDRFDSQLVVAQSAASLLLDRIASSFFRPWTVVVIIARRAVGFFAILARDGLLELQTGRAVRLR